MPLTSMSRALPVASLLALLAAPALADGLAAATYQSATSLLKPADMEACTTAALEALAYQAKSGTNVRWDQPMAPGETGRLISSTWAERVAAGPGEKGVPEGYLIAVTGRAHIAPEGSEPMDLVPVCWFEYKDGDKAISLYRVTLRR